MNPEDFLPSAISTDAFIMLMVAGSTFLTVLAVWNGLIARDPMRGREEAGVVCQDAAEHAAEGATGDTGDGFRLGSAR